jgi:hypothetical protein
MKRGRTSYRQQVAQIARDVRQWASEERLRNERIASALDDLATALERRTRLGFSRLSSARVVHSDSPSRA